MEDPKSAESEEHKAAAYRAWRDARTNAATSIPTDTDQNTSAAGEEDPGSAKDTAPTKNG